MTRSSERGRSPAAKARRMDKYRSMTRGGRRVVCDECKSLHPPPECPPGAQAIALTVMLPPWLHRELGLRVAKGDRSPWVVRLIRKALDV